MRSLVIFEQGPNWIKGQPAIKQDRSVMGPHLVRMRLLYDQGALLFGGPTAAGFGGMALLETTSKEEASALMDTDPAVLAGLMTYKLSELNPYFDAFSGRVWSPPAR